MCVCCKYLKFQMKKNMFAEAKQRRK
uniref:Uncharacterized protein n=1 Tax=Arundo donax TaxID=35708 RepID=A0A0A9CCN7_ARUDO